ncbi:MAG: alkaline phosphatase family protein [Clostridia bacterium]
MKLVKANYNNCITNLSCSIQKHFGITPKHDTIQEVDNLLANNKKNVIVVLCDGLGSNLIRKILPEDSFLRKNFIKDITSIMPATTTSSTSSFLSGLNPNEHLWLGWDMNVREINKTVTMFTNCEMGYSFQAEKYNVANKFYGYNDIITQIKQNGYTAKLISPFSNKFDRYNENNLKGMIRKILWQSKLPKKKFVYGYYVNPDSYMHKHGTNSEITINNIKMINNELEKLAHKLKNSILIVTADHGHINSHSILLSDYPDFLDTLEREMWQEPRLCAFDVKSGKEKEFEYLFNKYFGNYFILKTKSQIIEEGYFGVGKPSQKFVNQLADYHGIAIADKYLTIDNYASNKYLSMHAGMTEDEMIIPLIAVVK